MDKVQHVVVFAAAAEAANVGLEPERMGELDREMVPFRTTFGAAAAANGAVNVVSCNGAVYEVALEALDQVPGNQQKLVDRE